ncbi:TPA_asm: P7 [Erysimum trirhavirus 1]|nr:TPA_asm: P7 [Erysimum trirhavirus 1]
MAYTPPKAVSLGSTPGSSSDTTGNSSGLAKRIGSFTVSNKSQEKKSKNVEMDSIGTIYLTASSAACYGYTDPDAALRWCVKNVIEDCQGKVSDDESIASGMSKKAILEDSRLPRSAHSVIIQFLELLLTQDISTPGLVRYIVQEPTQLVIKNHWARALIRSKKSVSYGGRTDARYLLESPPYVNSEGQTYTFQVAVVCV